MPASSNSNYPHGIFCSLPIDFQPEIFQTKQHYYKISKRNCNMAVSLIKKREKILSIYLNVFNNLKSFKSFLFLLFIELIKSNSKSKEKLWKKKFTLEHISSHDTQVFQNFLKGSGYYHPGLNLEIIYHSSFLPFMGFKECHC